MAYENFKATVWSTYIMRELERNCTLWDFTWRQFEGEAKRGKEVKILGVGKPTIGDYTGASIGAPETVADQSTRLMIDQAKYFNFAVDDVDKAQATPGLMEALLEEATKELAVKRDKYVGAVANDASAKKTVSSSANTADKAKALVDAALVWLRGNDVAFTDNVVIEMTPWFYYRFKDKLVELKTQNDELIRKGFVGLYDNCKCCMSNNLYNDGTDDYIMVRTKKSIAAAGGIDKVEAFRPETMFCDAVKGLNCYGARLIRPKELYVIRAHNS